MISSRAALYRYKKRWLDLFHIDVVHQHEPATFLFKFHLRFLYILAIQLFIKFAGEEQRQRQETDKSPSLHWAIAENRC